jgi:hypothetical protein
MYVLLGAVCATVVVWAATRAHKWAIDRMRTYTAIQRIDHAMEREDVESALSVLREEKYVRHASYQECLRHCVYLADSLPRSLPFYNEHVLSRLCGFLAEAIEDSRDITYYNLMCISARHGFLFPIRVGIQRCAPLRRPCDATHPLLPITEAVAELQVEAARLLITHGGYSRGEKLSFGFVWDKATTLSEAMKIKFSIESAPPGDPSLRAVRLRRYNEFQKMLRESGHYGRTR